MGLFGKLGMDGDRLGTLSRRLDDVESDLRRMKGEWLDTHDKLAKLAGRLRKRAERELEAAAAEEPTQEAPQESDFEREIRIRRGPTRAWNGE